MGPLYPAVRQIDRQTGRQAGIERVVAHLSGPDSPGLGGSLLQATLQLNESVHLCRRLTNGVVVVVVVLLLPLGGCALRLCLAASQLPFGGSKS